MEFNLNFLYGIAYAFFLIILALIICAAVIWRKFKNFLVEELESRLVSPLNIRVTNLEHRCEKLENLVDRLDLSYVQNQDGIQQKFETIVRDVAELKARLEGMIDKFDMYLKLGGNYGKEH